MLKRGSDCFALMASLHPDRPGGIASLPNHARPVAAPQTVVLLYWSSRLADPTVFVVCSALSTFSWGEVYSLFPAMAADLYGSTHVSANFGALYTGKAIATIMAGPLASLVAEHQSWETIILSMAMISLADAALAACVLRGLVRDGLERRSVALRQQEGAAADNRGLI